jgi:hypothetical protein
MESSRIVDISFFIKISLYIKVFVGIDIAKKTHQAAITELSQFEIGDINRFEKAKHVINFLTPFLTFSKLVKNIKLFILLMFQN